MSIKTVLKASSVVLVLAASNLAVDTKVASSFDSDSKLLTCIFMPYCGGPDQFGPVFEPQDTKTETQDAKDEKVA